MALTVQALPKYCVWECWQMNKQVQFMHPVQKVLKEAAECAANQIAGFNL
jgi:hypothetical protein